MSWRTGRDRRRRRACRVEMEPDRLEGDRDEVVEDVGAKEGAAEWEEPDPAPVPPASVFARAADSASPIQSGRRATG